jgi:hypothetical protein
VVHRRVQPGVRRRSPRESPGERPPGHPVLDLQAAAGNRAVAALLLRAPDPDEKQHEDRARALGKQLDKSRDKVIEQLTSLSEAERKGLDEAAKVLPKDKAKLLRRLIAFAANPTPKEKHGQSARPRTGGKDEFESDATGGGKVKARSGMRFDGDDGNLYEDAFSLGYTGSDADSVHWLQFIWRQFVAEFPARKGGKPRREPQKGLWKRPSSEYPLTTDPDKPSWNVDVVRAESPFYERNQPLNRSPTSVVMFDPPSPGLDVVKPLFEGDEPATKVTSRAHFVTYLVRGPDIVHATEIDVVWEFDSPKFAPMKPPVMKAIGARALTDAQRKRLKEQFPGNSLDYLP